MCANLTYKFITKMSKPKKILINKYTIKQVKRLHHFFFILFAFPGIVLIFFGFEELSFLFWIGNNDLWFCLFFDSRCFYSS
jgi:hypothetical protein